MEGKKRKRTGKKGEIVLPILKTIRSANLKFSQMSIADPRSFDTS
jgi:hypothetical protein